MGRASDAPAAGSAGTRAAPKTPASSLPSAGQSHNAAPLPAGSHPQSEPHNEPERKAPHPSSPSPCRFPTKAICCRIFTPALPDYPAASLRDFLSGASTSLPKTKFAADSVLEGTGFEPPSADHLGLVKAVDALGQSIVIAVADAAHGGLDARFGQALGVANRHVLHSPVAMVNQAVTLDGAAVGQSLQIGRAHV